MNDEMIPLVIVSASLIIALVSVCGMCSMISVSQHNYDITIKLNVSDKWTEEERSSRIVTNNYFVSDVNGMVYETNEDLYKRLLRNYSYTVNVTQNGFINGIVIK